MWEYFFGIFEAIMIHFIDICIPVFGIYLVFALISDMLFRK